MEKVLHSYSIVETSDFTCRVPACQHTAGKDSRKKSVPRLFTYRMMCRGRTPPEAIWLISFVALGYNQASAPAVRAYVVAVTDRGVIYILVRQNNAR